MNDPRDILSMRLGQIKAMMMLATGQDGLEDLHREDKDFYLFTVSELINEAIEANKQI